MNLRPYTEDDYINGVPCIYKWHGGDPVTVFPFYLGPKLPFDGCRALWFRFPNGYKTMRHIGGSGLVKVLWAAKT